MKNLIKIVGASTLVILLSLSLNVNVNKSIKTDKSLTSLIQSASAEYSTCTDGWTHNKRDAAWVKSEVDETIEHNNQTYEGYFCYAGEKECTAALYSRDDAPVPPKNENDV